MSFYFFDKDIGPFLNLSKLTTEKEMRFQNELKETERLLKENWNPWPASSLLQKVEKPATIIRITWS